jgi:maltoporin
MQAGDEQYVAVDGSFNGSSAIGRLGNEANGGEFQLSKAFLSESGAVWDITVMFDHWGDEVNLKKAYAGVSNLFESQPNAYVWVGRDFNQRPQQGINDYFFMTHDGQGGGIKNLELGGLSFDVSVVGSVDNCDARLDDDDPTNPSRITCTGGADVGDSGHYAITSRLSGINLGIADLEIRANYGFDSKAINKDERVDAYQVAAILNRDWAYGSNSLILRYADNADNSVYSKVSDLTTMYASLEGNARVNERVKVEYLFAYHDYKVDNATEQMDDRTNYSAIVRPMYFWNNDYSTWLEAGYQNVEFGSASDSNDGWKVTLSQNIAFGADSDQRPMLRFYTTVGEVNNRVTDRTVPKEDTLSFGAMWEAWW